MKTDQELIKMSVEELRAESDLYFKYVRKIDGLVIYKESWDKK